MPIRSPLQKRFEAKFVAASNGCWLWTAAKKELGYGVIGLGDRTAGTAKAHRVAWQLYRGKIPTGLNVLHTCDTPACVNPDHLYLGTLKDNARDCRDRGRNFIPDNRGDRAKWRKLNSFQVAEIRTRQLSAACYAKTFGVSRRTVYAIWQRQNWRSI